MALVTQEELAKATGIKRTDALTAILVKQGISFFYGKGGRIWTTEHAINTALAGIKPETNAKIEFIGD